MKEENINNLFFKRVDNKWLVFAGIFIVSIIIIIVLYLEHDYNSYDEYSYADSYRAVDYDDFVDKYGEYAKQLDVTENNYRYYEKEAFILKYSKQISVEEQFVPEDKTLYVFLSNNSEFDFISAEIGIVYYDTNDKVIDVVTRNVYDIEKGQIYCEPIENNLSKAVKTTVVVKALESYKDKNNIIKDIEYEAKEDKEHNKIYLKCTNSGNNAVKRINGYILFYDEEENILFNDYISLYEKIKPKETVEQDLGVFLYGKKYDHFKVFINSVR